MKTRSGKSPSLAHFVPPPPLCWLFLSIDYVKTRTSGTGGKNWLFCFPSCSPNTALHLYFLGILFFLHLRSFDQPQILLPSPKIFQGPKNLLPKKLGVLRLWQLWRKMKKKPLKEKLCWNILIADVSDFCWWVICVTKRNCKSKWMRLRLL